MLSVSLALLRPMRRTRKPGSRKGVLRVRDSGRHRAGRWGPTGLFVKIEDLWDLEQRWCALHHSGGTAQWEERGMAQHSSRDNDDLGSRSWSRTGGAAPLSTGIRCERSGCERRDATAVYDWSRAHHDHEFGDGAWSYYCQQHRENRENKKNRRKRRR